MTPMQLTNLLNEVTYSYSGEDMTVPELIHVKAELDRALLDAITDPETPCPHDGSKWKHPFDGVTHCGQCGRRLEREAA
jgi:hypothetical protein